MSSGVNLTHHHHGGNTTSTSNSTATSDKMPSIFIERPKMPRATWEALRNSIIRERQRKKQEQEQSQEVERIKKEREYKKKQEAFDIEATKQEIAKTESKLVQLKEEKHQLFHTLKKVLNDPRNSKEGISHSNTYLQPTVRPNPVAHYMKPPPHRLMIQEPASSTSLSQVQPKVQSALKRPRSPSPPRNSINSAYYRTRNSAAIAPKYGSYSTSAVASVSAHHINYDGNTASGSQSGYHYPPLSRSHPEQTTKPYILTQSSNSSRPGASGYGGLSEHSAPLPSRTAPSASAYATNLTSGSSSGRSLSSSQAPPAAHGSSSQVQGFRGGSILSGYPRTVAYSTVTTTASINSQRLLQGPQQPNGGVRYYSSQREV